MAKFAIGDWVKDSRKGRRGRVCDLEDRSALVRWVGRDKSTRHGTKSLRASEPPRALVLEGSLDSNLASVRSGEGLLRTWLHANDVQLAYKNVHTLGDIEVLSKAVGSNRPPFVHISCHGDHDSRGRARIHFTPGWGSAILLNSPQTHETFRRAFEGMPLLFSACLLGRYQDEMKKFRKSARLGPIAAFTRSVYDSESMLFELLLYHGVLTVGWKFSTAVSRAREALSGLGLKGTRGKGQSFVRLF
jgi:hypothetical protein